MSLKTSTKRFVLSDETRNLYGFVTKTEGIDLTAFNDNPVMLYNHDYNKLIGQWQDIRIEGTKLTAAPAFDEEDDLAMQTLNKVEQGLLRGASIGISPKKFDDKKSEMSASILLEASLTPIPNNRNALAIYKETGEKLSAKEINTYLLSVERTEHKKPQKTNMNDKLLALLVALSAQAGHMITLSADSPSEEIEASVKKVVEYVGGLKTQNTQLNAKMLTLEMEKANAAEKEIDDILRVAVEQKKLTADKVASMKEVAKINLQAVKDILSVATSINLVPIPGAEQQQSAVGKENWDYDKYALEAPTELSAMRVSNPKLFEKLQKDKAEQARNKYGIA